VLLEEFLASSLTPIGEFEGELDLVECAESLRYAAEALGKVTGRIQVDEILDQLFSSFCIGK
jgi:tRNA modification GTPase